MEVRFKTVEGTLVHSAAFKETESYLETYELIVHMSSNIFYEETTDTKRTEWVPKNPGFQNKWNQGPPLNQEHVEVPVWLALNELAKG